MLKKTKCEECHGNELKAAAAARKGKVCRLPLLAKTAALRRGREEQRQQLVIITSRVRQSDRVRDSSLNTHLHQHTRSKEKTKAVGRE